MLRKTLLLFGLYLFGNLSAFSQSVSSDILQVPCNSDGIFEVTTNGVALPITYTYYVNGTTVVHANVNSPTDQLTGFDMASTGQIKCEVVSSNFSSWTFGFYTPSFNYNSTTTNPICPATIGTISATLSNGSPAGPMSYTWTNVSTNATYTGQNVQVPLGSYTGLIVDQASGCRLVMNDSLLHVTQASNVTANLTTTAASCTNGSITAAPSGGQSPYSFAWTNGDIGPTINNLMTGTYSVTVTDAQGCQSNPINAFVPQNPTINVNTTITNATCTSNDGEAMAFGSGGVGPYTYQWDNGQTSQQATGLQGATTYQVIATDQNGCIGRGFAQIGVNTPITVTTTSTNSSCTVNDGSATITASGGTQPYTYIWNSVQNNGTNVLSNVGVGFYSFQVTDAVGCVRTGAVYVGSASTLNANIGTSTVYCPNTTGNVMVTAYGTNPPFNYSWSNGATTSTITGVPLGGYNCTITDAQGCTVNKSTYLDNVSPLNIAISKTPVSCEYSADGSVSVTVSGGVAPYTYSYTGATGSSANLTGLTKGFKSVTVTDANGCSKSMCFTILNAQTSDNCYCTIKGNVYVDLNSNCMKDGSESGLENIMVHCTGFGFVYTDALGNYEFKVPSGTYTITEQINQYYPLASCQQASTTVTVMAASNCFTTVDFANDVIPSTDLKISTFNHTVPPIPGNQYSQKVWIRNEGTAPENNVQVGYQQDSQLGFSNASMTNFTQPDPVNEPYHFGISSGFPTMNPNDDQILIINYNTPTDIPLATQVQFFDTVTHAAPIANNWVLDNTPWNNVQTFQTYVIGAYDPNYKEVTPRGNGPEGYISDLVKEFDYTIHFQNEGTYFAQKIVITDQLDANFDWTTLKPGYSPYPYTTTVSETGLVTFTFDNINLPWKSQYGDALSSSLVNYSIKRKPNLPQGTVFENTADIYFDYNAPITTNTTRNTIMDSLASVKELDNGLASFDERTLELFPVPVSDMLTIRLNNIRQNEKAQLSIISITGTEVISTQVDLNEGTTVLMQPVTDLSPGTYLTRVVFEDGSSLIKRMVVR